MEDVAKFKTEIKNNISSLIEKGNIDSAKSLINEYENIVPNDIDICSTKAVISMIEGNFEEAENILREGLKADSSNFDILYNLGYLYQTLEKYNKAFRYYKRALKITKNQNEQKELNDILNNILDNHKDKLELYQYTDRKKALMVAYAFPPIGGSGVQRTLKFVKYLREFGWEPIVLTVGSNFWNIKDKSLLGELPRDIKIIRIDDVRPERLDDEFINKLLNMYLDVIEDKKIINEYIEYLKGNKDKLGNMLFIPEYQSVWARVVIDTLEDYIDLDNIDIVYTSADPYADNFIGYYLKKKHNIPWVADFRDEWTNHHYRNYDKTSIRYKMEFTMESKFVHTADKVITTTPISTENYRRIFGLEQNKVITITNGYDEQDFTSVIPLNNKNNKFTIMHNGIFHDGKNPETFLKALRNLIDKGLIDRKRVKVYFTVEDKWKILVKTLGLEKNVKYLGYLEHKKSLEIANKCDLLLLVVGTGDKLKQVIAAKMFEYFRLNKLILSLAPKGGAIDNIINETNRGYNVDYNDIGGIEEYLLKLYKDWESGKQYEFTVDGKVKRYERKELTKHLCNVFNDILGGKLELSCKNKNIELLKSRIKSLIKYNDFSTVKVLLGELEKESPIDIDFYYLKSLMFIKKEEFDKAEKILKDGLNIINNNVDLLYNLAHVYEKKRQYLKAIELYEKVAFSLGEVSKDSKNIIKHINELEQKYKKINEKQLHEQKKKKVVLGNKNLNIHLMYDSQYCDRFIRFVNKHFKNDEHLFIVISFKRKPLKFLNVDNVKNVKLIDLKYDLDKLVKYIESSSKIFIHFLFNYCCEIIYKLCENKEIYWILWGGDLYYYIDWDIYDNLTKELLEELGHDIRQEIDKNTLQYLYRKSAIRMIDYILTWNEYDYNIIKEHFLTGAQQLYFYYPNPINYKFLSQVEQIQLKDEYNFKKQFKYVVLVGNSADPSNNHLEIFNKLEKLDKNDFCIISPLSYGTNSLYTQEIIKEGKKRFGNRFTPILDYLSPEDYYSILKQVDVAIFNHNRQQAVGNIWALIYLGKKIYIKRDTTTYKWCDKLGIKLECIEDLCDNFDSFFEINPNILDKNKIILEKTVNSLKNLENLKDIFCDSD